MSENRNRISSYNCTSTASSYYKSTHHVVASLEALHAVGAPPLREQLRNKRPGLSGRPPCKRVAIGVARMGARLGGERALRVPSSCSFPVSHSGGPHVVSFVAGHRPCARSARVRAGVARRAAKSVRASWRGKGVPQKRRRKVPAKEQRTKTQDKKQRKLRACRRAGECDGSSVAVRAQRP